VAPDWKDRLKELGKDLFQGEREKKKGSQTPKPATEKHKVEQSADEFFKNIFGKEARIPEFAQPETRPESPVTPTVVVKSAKKAPLPKEMLEDGERVTVGLDFGTSFTKACLRRELGGDDVPIYPVVFQDAASTNGGSPLWPSFVSVEDGKVFFGKATSMQRPGNRTYFHIKVCLACKAEHSSSECVSAEICPFKGEVASASDFMTLYLAWVMREARQRVPKPMRGHRLSFLYNVGVPIKHLDWGKDDRLYKKYRKIAFDAWRLSEGVFQGIELTQVLDWISQLRGLTVPSPEISRVQLAPESSAAIVSYVNSVEAELGLYCIVDIGAWTTDVSFFRLTDVATRETGVQRLAFYAADVWRKATSAIDERLVECLMEMAGIKRIKQFVDGDPVSCLRGLRESERLVGAEISYTTERGTGDAIEIPDYVTNFARGVVCEGVRRDFTSTFRAARQKEPPMNFENFTLFLTGGGSNESWFQEKICQRYSNFHPRVRDDMLAFPTLQADGTSRVSKRLAVAAGLSYPLGMWPDQLRPSQIDNWTRLQAAKIAPADDEPG
jgi:hypothetical protein